jgi:hypothetical protein
LLNVARPANAIAFGFGRFAPTAADSGQCSASRKRPQCGDALSAKMDGTDHSFGRVASDPSERAMIAP